MKWFEQVKVWKMRQKNHDKITKQKRNRERARKTWDSTAV